MWLSVAFPRCPRCGENSNKCYHRSCPAGGKDPLEINTDNSKVRCPSCSREWPIMSSNYYCTCNYVFSAEDVSIELDAIVANAKLIAQEIKRMSETQQRIDYLTTLDIERRATDTIKKTFGEKIWNSIKNAIPAIVAAVKAWLNIK